MHGFGAWALMCLPKSPKYLIQKWLQKKHTQNRGPNTDHFLPHGLEHQVAVVSRAAIVLLCTDGTLALARRLSIKLHQNFLTVLCVKLWFRVLGSRLNRVLGSSLSRERAGWDLLHRGLGLGLGRGLLPHRLACRLGRLHETLSLPVHRQETFC